MYRECINRECIPDYPDKVIIKPQSLAAFGGWWQPQNCPRSNQLATAFTFAWERSCGGCDDTGGNGVWFHCGNKYQDYTSEKVQNNIGGTVGFDNARQFYSCPKGQGFKS